VRGQIVIVVVDQPGEPAFGWGTDQTCVHGPLNSRYRRAGAQYLDVRGNAGEHGVDASGAIALMPRDSLVLTLVLGELVGFVWAVLATAEAFNFPDPGLALLLLWPAYVVLLAAGGRGPDWLGGAPVPARPTRRLGHRDDPQYGGALPVDPAVSGVIDAVLTRRTAVVCLIALSVSCQAVGRPPSSTQLPPTITAIPMAPVACNPPSKRGGTIGVGSLNYAPRSIDLPADACWIRIESVSCKPPGPCPQTPLYSIRRGHSAIVISAGNGRVESEDLAPGEEQAFRFLNAALL
jgi:hypothetical protein